jgi:hypothetical protein
MLFQRCRHPLEVAWVEVVDRLEAVFRAGAPEPARAAVPPVVELEAAREMGRLVVEPAVVVMAQVQVAREPAAAALDQAGRVVRALALAERERERVVPEPGRQARGRAARRAIHQAPAHQVPAQQM